MSRTSGNFREIADENLLTNEELLEQNDENIVVSHHTNQISVQEQQQQLLLHLPQSTATNTTTNLRRKFWVANTRSVPTKRFKRNNSMDFCESSMDDVVHDDSKMNIESTEDDKRANFSALNNMNGSTIKLPTNNSSKPGDIKKIIIKNFKSK